MTVKEKMTAPIASVGADVEQPLQNLKTNQSIADLPGKGNLQATNNAENAAKSANKKNPDDLEIVSMMELYDTAYPPKLPIVDGLLYNGTYLFVGSPKIGKSFFMAQIGYHISKGLPLWGFSVRKGTVLYLALEDDYARLQKRLSQMFGMEGSENFYFATKSKSLNDGLEKQLVTFVTEHKDARLIIIDTLQKVREVGGDKFSYASDYEIVTKLKAFSDKYGICFLVVHHTRKMESSDSFDMISGTNGLLGAADGAFVMQKEKRTDNKAVLEVAGRDQQDQKLWLKYQVQRSECSMIKKLRVAVDHGNRNMKTCHFIFTTGLTEQDKKPARGEKYLKYQGKYYTLSEKRIPYQRDKTQDSRNRFWILTLFAIAMELEQKSQIQPEDVIQVELPIGLPPKHFAELCERYERYFKGDGKVQELCFNDKVYHLCIQNVMAFPQDYAAMMTRMMEIREIPKVVGIDIGGFTSDYLLMRSGRPDIDYCDSLEKGVITMYNDIISSINSEYDMLLEEADIDSIIKGKTQYYEEAVVQAVETMVQNFVTDLLNSIRERGIDTKSTYTVFIGGGAVLLERFLEQADRLGKHTFIRDMKANADGYDLLYRMTQAGV